MSAPEADRAPSRDAYIAAYMDGARAIAVETMRLPRWWAAAFGALASLGVVVPLLSSLAKGHLAAGAALTSTLTLGIVALIMLLFTHLRVVVTHEALHVQLGVWGPRIPLQSIRSARAGMYDWKQWGGWGIRRGRSGGWSYSVPGGSGQCVEVQWIDDAGRERTHVITVEDSAAILAAIERGRGAVTAETGVRVEDPHPADEARARENSSVRTARDGEPEGALEHEAPPAEPVGGARSAEPSGRRGT